MSYKWNRMTNSEKNKLISTKVLELECFSTSEGIQWYEKHYQLGNWHYTTNLNDAMDLSKRVIIDNLEMVINYSGEKFQCKISIKNKTSKILGEAVSYSLSESICLAILQFKNIKIEI
jgi:hypothetical protein